jgi:hypothetical protein
LFSPHPNRSILGVILPRSSFTPASKVLRLDDTSRFYSTSIDLARVMIAAARGLEFAGSLGLAFRDLLEKNLGFLDENGETIV